MRPKFALFFCLISFCFSWGTLVEDDFYSQSLGEEVPVNIHLPEGYVADGSVTYPAVYYLHCHGCSHDGNTHVVQAWQDAITGGHIVPCILVKPEGMTLPYLGGQYDAGSWWLNSEAFGPYEDMIVFDLPAYMDSVYNTSPDRDDRFLVGWSMGGYGAMTLALKHSDRYSGVSAHSSPLLTGGWFESTIPEILAENGGAGPFTNPEVGLFTFLMFDFGTIFTPDPTNPPYYANFAIDDSGMLIDSIYTIWEENTALRWAAEYSGDHPLDIHITAGNQNDYVEPDILSDTDRFIDSLDVLGIAYSYEQYATDHTHSLFAERALAGLRSFTTLERRGQLEHGSFIQGNSTRHYYTYLPQGFQPGLPLVLNLHGMTYSPQWTMENSYMDEVADTAGFIACYPQGLELNWSGNADDVAFIDRLIDTLHTNYSIDLDRVYVCGWSAGAGMTLVLAYELGHRLAKVGSVGFPMLYGYEFLLTDGDPIPVLFMVGTDDFLQPSRIPTGETMSMMLERNGCTDSTYALMLPDLDITDSCLVEVIQYPGCPENAALLLYNIHGGGHWWPGVDPALEGTETIGDFDDACQDIIADVELWHFFNGVMPVSGITGQEFSTPDVFLLSQNYPNPFNPTTSISYDLPTQSDVMISVYDIMGREITILRDGRQSAGTYQVEWSGRDDSGNLVSTGVYFCRLQAGDYCNTIKMVYLR